MAIYQSQYSGKQIDNAVVGILNLTNYQQALKSNGTLDNTKLKLLANKLEGDVPSATYAQTAGVATSSTTAQTSVTSERLTILTAQDEANLLSLISSADIGRFIKLQTTNSLYAKVKAGTNLSCCVQICSGIGEPTATLASGFTDRYNVSISCLSGSVYALDSSKKAISLTITLPTTSEMLLSETITSLTFSTLASIVPTLTINGGTIVFKGEDTVNGTFSPQANATYEISIWYNGSLWVGSVVKWA